MNDSVVFGNFRAVLGDGDDKAFTIVTVDRYGSISWLAVSEPEFNAAEYDDLPPDLFEKVNDFYDQLNFSIDDTTVTADIADEDR
jgi:hypothetical protein